MAPKDNVENAFAKDIQTAIVNVCAERALTGFTKPLDVSVDVDQRLIEAFNVSTAGIVEKINLLPFDGIEILSIQANNKSTPFKFKFWLEVTKVQKTSTQTKAIERRENADEELYKNELFSYIKRKKNE